MTKLPNIKSSKLAVNICFTICVIAIILGLAMFASPWMALAAGVANVSVILFSFSIVVATGLWLIVKDSSTRFIATVAAFISFLALLVPLVATLMTAKSVEANLSFNPASYLKFSGSTDTLPTFSKIYKQIGNQKLELSYYKPETKGEAPVVVLLHGGAWRYGDRLETGQWPKILTSAGYAVVSVDYRLSNDTYHSWEDTPLDIHDAMTYLTENAAVFSIDTDQMHIMGQSAGGHLALLEAYRFQSVKSAIALYAPIDLTLDYETSRDKSAELDFIGGTPNEYQERYTSLSPLKYINPNTPPTLLIQGMYDDLVHPSQATRLGESLNALNVENEVLLLPFTGHSFENQRGGFGTQIATQRVLHFLD